MFNQCNLAKCCILEQSAREQRQFFKAMDIHATNNVLKHFHRDQTQKKRLTSGWAFLDHHTSVWAAEVEGEACGKAGQVRTRTDTQQSALAKWLQGDWSSSALQDLKGQISTSTLGQKPLEEHNSPLGEGRPWFWKYWSVSLTLSLCELLWTSGCAALQDWIYWRAWSYPGRGCSSRVLVTAPSQKDWGSIIAELLWPLKSANIHSRSPERKENNQNASLKKTQVVAANTAHVFTLLFPVCFFTHNRCPSNWNNSKVLSIAQNKWKLTPVMDLQLPSPLWLNYSVKYFTERAETSQWQPRRFWRDLINISRFKRQFPLSFAAQDCHSMAAEDNWTLCGVPRPLCTTKAPKIWQSFSVMRGGIMTLGQSGRDSRSYGIQIGNIFVLRLGLK